MKLVLEIPDDKYQLMVGLAGWYDMALDRWIDETLSAQLAGDLESVAQEQKKSKPIRELK